MSEVDIVCVTQEPQFIKEGTVEKRWTMKELREDFPEGEGTIVDGLLTRITALSTELQQARERLEASEAASAELIAWLKERWQWLTREAHSGGDFQHLTARREECGCIAHKVERLSAALPADGPGDTP